MRAAPLPPEVAEFIEFDRAELVRIFRAQIYELSDDLAARISRLILAQLLAGSRHRWIQVQAVMDEIRALEGEQSPRVPRTKPATPFKHTPLKGLHHKHWFESSFIAANLAAHYSGTKGEANLDAKIRGGLGQDLWEAAGRIAHSAVHGGHTERAQNDRLTGQWIVYREGDTGNGYLAIASHAEGDEVIAAAIRKYCEPELFAGW